MGISVNNLRFLLYAKSFGVDFTKTALIGRQVLNTSFEEFSHIIRNEFKHDVDSKTLEAIYNERYADELFRYLGANEVHSFDYSDYEGATYIHNFNENIPENFFAQYTAVIEGGTLEHIFNFPIAIKNCMQMIKVGGHYLGMSPANNNMGHGFYQFSPELYFRVFSQRNGFHIEHIILLEGKETKKWLKVTDPYDVKRRVQIKNSMKTSLQILSTRLTDCHIFSTPPLQSDYVPRWNGIEKHRPVKKRWFPQSTRDHIKSFKNHWLILSIRNFKKLTKNRIKAVMIALGQRHDPRFFKPFNPFESKAKPSTHKASSRQIQKDTLK